MAVTIKKKALTIVSLVERLFGSEDLHNGDLLNKAAKLQATGHTLAISPTTFSICTPTTVLSKVPLKLDTVQLAMKKKLGQTVKVVIKDKVIDLINVAHNKTNVTAVPFQTPADAYDATMMKYHANGGSNKVAAIKHYRTLTGVGLKQAKDQVEAWIAVEEAAAGEMPMADTDEPDNAFDHTFDTSDTVTFDEVETKLQLQVQYPIETNLQAAPVPLKEAQKLNQPVGGTSGGSIYHVIAIGGTCVVAARIKSNNEIAIRAEITVPANSTDGQKAKSGLRFAGLEQKPAGHFSLHLDPEDFAMVKRSIGSTLMAMSIPFWGVSTDLHVLQGVGK